MPTTEYLANFPVALIFALIPIAWTIILYPLSRRLDKSWASLVGIVILLSFAVLLALPMTIKRIPLIVDEASTHLLSLFTSMSVIVLIFIFKARWLEALPGSHDYFDRHIHLRHVIQIGIEMEERGSRFYKELCQKTNSEQLRDLCERLARDEEAHRQIISYELKKFLPLPLGKKARRAIEKEIEKLGLFKDQPGIELDDARLIEYAINQEHMLAKFYDSFAIAFPKAWKRLELKKLSIEEQEHARLLGELRSPV